MKNCCEEYKLGFENAEIDYLKRNRRKLDNVLIEKLGVLYVSKQLQNINKHHLLVSYDFNSVYPSAQIIESRIWPKIDTAFPFEK